jgi:NAD-dependent SIR2 family protein deacetylase
MAEFDENLSKDIEYAADGFPQFVKSRGGTLIEVGPYETELKYICDVSIRGESGEALPELVTRIKVKVGK